MLRMQTSRQGTRKWVTRQRARSARGPGRALIACVALLLVAAPESAAATDHPYVALGDSVARGYGVSESQSYVGWMYATYQPSLGVDRLLNRSQNGATSTSLKDGGQLAQALADINAASDTEAVTIDIGGNDYLNGQCTTNWDDPSTCPYRANLASILSQLQAALDADPADERFAVMAYYNPGVGLPSEAEFDLAGLGANLAIGLSDTGADVGLNDVIYREAAKLGVPVADPWAAFKAHGQAFMYDRVHPNEAGHAAIAQAFCEATTVSCVAPPPPPPPPPPPADTAPPRTHFTKRPPNKTERTKVKFKFTSSEPNSTFECKLDTKKWKRCESPRKLDGLKPGKHKFKVRAIDAAGNVDPSPAKDKFKILKPKRKR
jgi:lysophospholipase L1-like esterase